MPRRINDALELVEQAAPATPAAGFVCIYVKADGQLYSKDDAGVETSLGDSGIMVQTTAPGSPSTGDLWLDSDAPSGTYDDLAVFGRDGALTVAAGLGRYRFPFAVTLLGVTAAINTAPTGASVIADVNKNGTTVYSTQGNRPTIVASAFATAAETTPDVTALALGDYLTVDIDQIGSTIAGSDLTVFVRYRRT